MLTYLATKDIHSLSLGHPLSTPIHPRLSFPCCRYPQSTTGRRFTSVEPSIVQDAIVGGEGTQSHAVCRWLDFEGTPTPRQQDKSTSPSYLPASRVTGTLQWAEDFRRRWPSKALFGLVTSLRKVGAQSGLDQSKTPFSQLKPFFSIKFPLVGVPYHSEYLDGVTDTVAGEDLDSKELWEATDLKIPFYNTEDGISLL